MREPEVPVPPEHKLASSNAISLEQLLSLKQSGRASDDAVPLAIKDSTADGPAEQSFDQELDASTSSHLPLLMVVVGNAASGVAITGKLNRLAKQVRLSYQFFGNTLVEQVQLVQPYAVVIHFAPDTIESASGLAKQVQQTQPHLPIFALGSTHDSQTMLAALRAGVKDFLDVDATEIELQNMLAELLARNAPAPAQEPESKAPLVALLSARAGLGTSLLATHLALYVQQSLSKEPARPPKDGEDKSTEPLTSLLLDLGAPAGDGALYLDLASEFDFVDAVQSLRRFDKKLASAGLTQHESGLRVLSLSRLTSRLSDVSYGDVELLVQRLRQYFEFIVADLGAIGHTNLSMRVAKRASKVWVLCDQSLASVVSTAELLRHFEEQKIDRELVQLIVCRHDRNLELSAQHIAEQLKLPLLATVPERRVELLQAINQGQLLSAKQRREPYVQAVLKLTDQLLSEVNVPTSHAPSAVGWLLQKIKG